MALGKIFGTLFKDPDEGPTAEEIDAETEAAVRAIMEENTGAVGADAVLASGWGEPGDMVYIMNLSPLYGLLGERVGRAADNLRINCKEVFVFSWRNVMDMACEYLFSYSAFTSY